MKTISRIIYLSSLALLLCTSQALADSQPLFEQDAATSFFENEHVVPTHKSEEIINPSTGLSSQVPAKYRSQIDTYIKQMEEVNRRLDTQERRQKPCRNCERENSHRF